MNDDVKGYFSRQPFCIHETTGENPVSQKFVVTFEMININHFTFECQVVCSVVGKYVLDLKAL
jgi:hypothetical protein